MVEFVNKLHIPVIHTMMAKGIIPFDNPYCLWTIGIPQKDYASKVLENADLILSVGYDIVEYAPAKWNSDQHKNIIHIDARPAHINKLHGFNNFALNSPLNRDIATIDRNWFDNATN